MTIDITELAQRMKAAAVRAKAATEDYVAHRMSITVYLEECKEFNDLSDGPDNILALLEALEKAQQENTAGVAGMAESYETTISMLKSRISELESRTVTVKLPRPGFITISGERMAVYLKGDVDAAMLAAGIEEAE